MGGAHPHAGLETVTLFLEGNVADKDDTTPGDAQWMTAGRGVIYSENILAAGRSRILQLWIRLPKADRSVPPRVQLLRKATLPIRREPGAEVRLYSGSLAIGRRRDTGGDGPGRWLDRPVGNGASALRWDGGERGARVVLYAGQPQREPLIHHGPFVAAAESELVRLFTEYRAGRFQRLSQLTSTVA